MGDRNLVMDSFLDQFSSYDDCAPPGVLLPEIKIASSYYTKLDIPSDCSNYDFLRRLCFRC